MFSVPLLQLQNRYGDVFSLQMAWKPVLVTCGEDTADRPEMPIFQHLGYGEKAKGKMQCGGRDGIRANLGDTEKKKIRA